MSRYSRDPFLPRPPRWGRIYDHHFPNDTDSASRHVKVIAQRLRDTRDPLRRLLIDAGYQPDHMAASMETTVKALWALRRRTAP